MSDAPGLTLNVLGRKTEEAGGTEWNGWLEGYCQLSPGEFVIFFFLWKEIFSQWFK